MKFLATLAVTVALVSGTAMAADDISPAKLALAKEFMALSGSTAAYNTYEKNLDLMVDQLRQHMPGADDATMADIKKIAVEEFEAFKPELKENAAKIYAQHFSEKDLKGLIAFYKTEAGKHFAAETPALTAESVQLMEPFNHRFFDRLRQYMMARMAAEQKAQEGAPDSAKPADPEAPKGTEKPESKGK